MADAKILLSAEDRSASVINAAIGRLGNLQSASNLAGQAMGRLGVALSVGAMVAWLRATIDGIDALNDLKDATGSSIENISALQDVATRTGTSFDTVSSSLVKFNAALKDAKPGSDAEAAFQALGLSVRELQTLDPAQALLKTAQALATFADDGNKARLTQELFGKSLREVAPFLKDLADKGQLVATVTTQQAEEAERFNKALFELKANADNAGRALASNFVTGINAAAKAYRESGLVEAFTTLFNGSAENRSNRQFVQDADTQLMLEQRIEKAKADGYKEDDRGLKILRAQLATVKARLATQLEDRNGSSDTFAETESLRRRYGPRSLPAIVPGRKPSTGGAAKDTDPTPERTTALETYRRAIEQAQGITSKASASTDGLNESQRLLRDYLQSNAFALLQKVNPAINAFAVAQLVAASDAEDMAAAQEKGRAAVTAATKDYAQWLDTLQLGSRSAQDQIQALQDEAAATRLAAQERISLEEATQRVAIARLQEKQVEMMGNPDAVLALQKEIDLRRQLLPLITGKNQQSRLNDLLGNTSGAKLERDRADMALLAEAFNKGLRGEAGGISEQQYLEAVAARLDLTNDKLKEGRSLADDLGLSFSSAFEDAIAGGKDFSQVLLGLEQDIIRIVARKLITEPVGNFITSTLLATLSFAGGGYTGSGPRSGGLDGQGGFMAMVHPQETIIDHRSSSPASSAPAVSVVQNFTVGDVASVSLVRDAVANSERRIAATLNRSLSYGGAIA